MPVLPDPVFHPPFWQWNAHLQTICPSLLRKPKFRYDLRERLELPDGDFVDLDWSRSPDGSRKLVIITHGLEGDSRRHYVLGMAKIFREAGYDALGWNCRSCSGEMNRLLCFYHHGDASDLHEVIRHSMEKYSYDTIVLVGFSMGGSLSIRAVATDPAKVPAAVKAVVAFSTPCNLESSVRQLMLPENRLYQSRFLRKLGEKIREKAKMYPDQLSVAGYADITNFFEFDDRYTAPLHGYKDATDFYARASVAPLLPDIKTPTLLVQARNDSFLRPDCYGLEAAAGNPYLSVELPAYGGHCGFQVGGSSYTWAEKRAVEFAQHFL